MDNRTIERLSTDVSRIRAMLDQHIADCVSYRTRMDRHLARPRPRPLCGIMLGIGWTAIVVILVIALWE